MHENGRTHYSRNAVKEALVEVIKGLTDDDIRPCYMHTSEFLSIAREKGHVFSQRHYEKTHKGDEHGSTAAINAKVDKVLDKYMPDGFSIYTRSTHPELDKFTAKRIDPVTLNHSKENSAAALN